LFKELLVACEEAQEKGDTFTYRYLLFSFSMLKWMPPVGIPLSPSDKGRMKNIFRPWHSTSESDNTAFNNAMLSKWYKQFLDTNHRLCIP
jgi:hypothetical protein